MLQSELFDSPRIGRYLGSGMFSRAYLMSNGLVCKVGWNDGTRNWLEFCMLERLAGRLLPLMPEVFDVASIGYGERYMATMPAYEDGHCHKHRGYSVLGHESFADVLQRFLKYMAPRLAGTIDENETADWLFNDLHSGNTMVCPKRGIIITDPNACPYRTMVKAPRFRLQ